MKRILCPVFLSLLCAVVFAAKPARNAAPEFSDGDFMQWLVKTVKYPEMLKLNKIAGIATVDFWVDANGKVVDNIFNIHNQSAFANAVVDAIRKSPAWIPKNKKIYQFTIKVDFNDLFDSTEREGVMSVDNYTLGNVNINKWLIRNYKLPSDFEGKDVSDKIKFRCTLDQEGVLTGVIPVECENRKLAEHMAGMLTSAGLKGIPAKADGEAMECIVEYTVRYPFELSDSKMIGEMPGFMGGGLMAFHQWVSKEITMPLGAKDGRVIANFVVEKDGSVGRVRVVKTHDFGLALDVVRILEHSPKWKPGLTKDGKETPVLFTIPVRFGYR